MMTELPFLSKNDGCFAPKNGRCLECGLPDNDGGDQVSLHGGAFKLGSSGSGGSRDEDQATLFVYAGVHLNGKFCVSQLELANNLGGQFNLLWCSFACMRKTLNAIVDQLEAGLQPATGN